MRPKQKSKAEEGGVALARYTILPGDTINSIAERAGITREEFLELNPGIESRSDVSRYEGHSVRLGSGNSIRRITFADVARSYGISREELLSMNPHLSENVIGSGADVTGWEIQGPGS